MERKIFKKPTLFVLFAYIVIFITTTSTGLNRAGLVAVLGCGALYFLVNDLSFKSTVFFRSMFIYGIMLLYSRMYTIAPASKVDEVFSGYLSMFIVITVITMVVDDENDVNFLLKAFAVAGLAQFIYMLSVYGTDIITVVSQSDEGIRIGDEVSNANSVGMSFAISYLISLHFFLTEKMAIYKRAFFVVLIVIGFIFGLLSGSRKALIMLLAGSFAILYFKNSGKNVLKTLGGVLLAGIAVYALFYLVSSNALFETVYDRFTTLIDGLSGKTELDYSSEARFYMIETGWNVFKQSPIIGKGIYASYNYFETYSHNNFIEILMNTGMVGFLIFYYPYIVGVKTFLTMDKSAKLYPVMLTLFAWILIGGYGMVTYYSKDTMSLMALVCLWLSIQGGQKHEKIA